MFTLPSGKWGPHWALPWLSERPVTSRKAVSSSEMYQAWSSCFTVKSTLPTRQAHCKVGPGSRKPNSQAVGDRQQRQSHHSRNCYRLGEWKNGRHP